MAVFQIDGLGVAYGAHIAVSDLSLSLDSGQSLALLGLNGAGKTSTIRTLIGMLKPHQGSVQVFGTSPGKTESFRRLGYAPEEATPPEFLTGLEYLTFVAGLRGQGRRSQETAREWIDFFELDPRKPIKSYSKGMRRRVILAQAMIGSPELLILDEPFNGLDPLLIKKLRERLENYVKGGGSLLLSSHILAEVEKICDIIAIVHRGRIKRVAPKAALVEEFQSVEEAFSQLVSS